MATKCFPVVRGKRLRATRLDSCGNPVPPETEDAFVVTKGFVSVALTAEIEEGDDHFQKNADGEICYQDKSKDSFKRWTIELTLCGVDPALWELLGNATLETDWNGDTVGIRGYEGSNPAAAAIEVWTGIPGEDCFPNTPASYGYLLLPFVEPGVLGDMTIENGGADFTLSGHTRGGGGWGIGPYPVVPTDAEHTPGPLAVPMQPREHHLLRTTTVAPPEPQCGAQTMPEYDLDPGNGDG